MAGIQKTTKWSSEGASGLIRTYKAVALLEDAPDNTIALYSLTAGEAAVTTVEGDAVTLAVPAGGFVPVEVLRVNTWSGAGTLYNCIR